MIKINNLTKIYKSGKQKTVALENINLTLPNKGMVFICGRSGSGKSTLLNIMGSLDKPTSGDVFIDGIKVNSLGGYDSAKYRNDCIGFIFQDFALLETMTVRENVNLALGIKNETNDKAVRDVLTQLGIERLSERKVTRLSAGQKQRVAIARAVIKNPGVILADEPTGNLDKESGRSVLEYLKKKSADCLVVIISHNLNDAFEFADRIVTLSHGKVKSDVLLDSANRKYQIRSKTLYINDMKHFSKKDIENVNKALKRKKINTLRPLGENLKTATEIKDDEDKAELVHHRVKSSNIFFLFKKILGPHALRAVLFSILAMAMVGIMAMCQMLMTFDSNEFMDQTIRNDESEVTVIKQELSGTKINNNSYVLMDEAEKQDLVDSGGLELTNYIIFRGSLNIAGSYYPSYTPYANMSTGVMLASKGFIQSTFSTTDENYLVKECETYEKGGIYVTDYTADMMISAENIDLYSSSLGQVTSTYTKGKKLFYVNGIINTGYKERFKDFLSSNIADEDSKEYLEFSSYVFKYLTNSYSFEENFLDYAAEGNFLNYWKPKKSVFSSNGLLSEVSSGYFDYSSSIVDDEIGISPIMLNSIFDTVKSDDAWTSYFSENTLDLKISNASGKTMTLKGLKVKILSNKYERYLFSKTNHAKLLRFCLGTFGGLFQDKDKAIEFYKRHQSTGMRYSGILIDNATYIFNFVAAYQDLFEIIFRFMAVASIAVIIFMSYSAVKYRKYDIGVLKAMGMANRDINRIYVLNLLFNYVLYAVFYTGFLFMFRDIGNYLLVGAIKSIKNLGALDFTVFSITSSVVYIDIGVIFISSIIGLILPILFIQLIRPIDMLRSKY